MRLEDREDLAEALAQLRTGLTRLDKLSSGLDLEKKKAVRRAMTALHGAEDRLDRAIRNLT